MLNSKEWKTCLHGLQLLQPFLHELLYPSLIPLLLMFPKSIARPAFRVFSEVVCGELAPLSEKRAVLDFPRLVSMTSTDRKSVV